MKYISKHDRKIESRIVESIIESAIMGSQHVNQINSGNTGALKALKDKKTIGRAGLTQERVVNALNPEHKKFNDKRNRKRRQKREEMKKGTGDEMRKVLDSVADANDLVSHLTGK